jgi:hypothetical protein
MSILKIRTIFRMSTMRQHAEFYGHNGRLLQLAPPDPILWPMDREGRNGSPRESGRLAAAHVPRVRCPICLQRRMHKASLPDYTRRSARLELSLHRIHTSSITSTRTCGSWPLNCDPPARPPTSCGSSVVELCRSVHHPGRGHRFRLITDKRWGG